MTREIAVAMSLTVAACSPRGWRTTPYQGEMLNVRTRGAETLAIETRRDPHIAAYVHRSGNPDYVLVTGPADVELVYYRDSRLVHFHRIGGKTETGELAPLPLEVVNVLPPDPRAGTPGPIAPEESPVTGCWRVALARDTCRTCCRSQFACSSTCQPAENIGK
jgi:hypothetical protein